MKRFRFIIVLLLLLSVKTAMAQDCPILPETTCITYYVANNPRNGTSSLYKITENGIVMNHSEKFGSIKDSTSCKYDSKEYKELIDQLSKIPFTVSEGKTILGGPTWGYVFEVDGKEYLEAGKCFVTTGDFETVERLIKSFIREHMLTRKRHKAK